ncbi:Hsp20/alpha crystallin family protein [Thermus caliditerrae]|uniref:Hsp20/alpha crystallin family protein n=1 Tax=Thermus caliditerrae TaxID=1330700 RepID=UPI00056E08BA|nr:Hsp20/alpha crystallin family protein [Thermus caliditerrae]
MLDRPDHLETLRKLKELQERIAELAYQLTGALPEGQPLEPAAWVPRVDLLEDEEHYVLLVDLPGVRPEDLELLEEGSRVTLAGVRHPLPGTYLLEERPMGTFRRTLELPGPIEEGTAQASLRQGVLEVRFRKREGAKLPLAQ